MCELLYRQPAWLLAAMLFSSLAATTVSGQVFDQASLSREDRDRQLDELAREVSALEKQGLLLRKLVRLTTPSVVHIDAEKPNEEGRLSRRPMEDSRRPMEEAGSGVIMQIDGQNYIVTNRHVIDDAALASVKIKLDDGRILHPTKKWEDRETDVAVLAIQADDLVAVRLGDSEKVDIGDFVLAVGSPFGLSQSVTFGIISAKGRRDLELGDGSIKYQDFFQTDAAINPGNSGGPLLNLRGEVIGINTAIASSSGGSEGIGFTIPINMVMTVATQFVKYGKVVRAYLGVELSDDFTPETVTRLGLSRPRGALVKRVKPNTPAASGGLREDDVILEFDGLRVDDDEHLIKIVAFTQAGKEIDVVVFRQGKLTELTLKVGDRTAYPNP